MNVDPIDNRETLYRRVPVSTNWYQPELGLKPEAFGPTKDDLTGISLSRAKYKSIQEAARGRPGKLYYIALLNAAKVKSHGISVEPCPLEDDLGHSEIPDINYGNRKDTETQEKQRILASLCDEVHGPFSQTAAE